MLCIRLAVLCIRLAVLNQCPGLFLWRFMSLASACPQGSETAAEAQRAALHRRGSNADPVGAIFTSFPAAQAGSFLALDGDDDAAAAGSIPMLAQIDALPGAEAELSVTDRDHHARPHHG